MNTWDQVIIWHKIILLKPATTMDSHSSVLLLLSKRRALWDPHGEEKPLVKSAKGNMKYVKLTSRTRRTWGSLVG